MKSSHYYLLMIVLVALACQQRTTSPSSEKPSGGEEHKVRLQDSAYFDRQLLVVITDDWNDVSGTLRRFEGSAGNWKEIGSSIPIVVGRKGMGWGRGISEMNQVQKQPGPTKKEGDLKSPAGIFQLGAAFGYASKEEANWIKADYIAIQSVTQCIEDIHSRYYNQIVPDTLDDADWNSTDHMLRKDDLYEWGMVVAHNTENTQPGAGSCIFLHVANPKGTGTAGCTAMEKERMREVLGWIDPEANPLLVQMPAFAYADFQRFFNYPEL